MTFYEYKCSDCGIEFSKIVFNEDDRVECIKCSGSNVVRIANKHHTGGCPCCTPSGCSPLPEKKEE